MKLRAQIFESCRYVTLGMSRSFFESSESKTLDFNNLKLLQYYFPVLWSAY